jgi:hypothetical protein
VFVSFCHASWSFYSGYLLVVDANLNLHLRLHLHLFSPSRPLAFLLAFLLVVSA